MSKIRHRECLGVHGDDLECAICAPVTMPKEALILGPSECLVISMPLLDMQQQDEFTALVQAWRDENPEFKVLVVYGAEQLAVLKP